MCNGKVCEVEDQQIKCSEAIRSNAVLKGPAGGSAGAVQTIITLLKKPENRCAAVTMLGKTVEMCYLQARSI